MAIQSHIQILRGETSKAAAYSGFIGELVYDTGKKTVRAMDGTTTGGTILAKEGIKLKTDAEALLKFNTNAEADHSADISITLDTAKVADKVADEIVDDADIAKKLAPALVSSKTDNGLSVASGTGEDGLLFVTKMEASDLVGTDAILFVDSNDKIATNLQFDYDNTTGKFTVKGGSAGTTLIKEMTIPTSLTLLEKSEVVKNPGGTLPAGTYLKLTFNTQSGTDNIAYINVTDFVDVYTAGDGLTTEVGDDHKFKIFLALTGNQAKFDSVTKALIVPTDYGTLD